jgi:PAS domain S-box-containing protein
MRGFSLKTKMATVVSVLFLIIFAAGAFMFERVFEEHFKKTIADQQFELVSKIAYDVDLSIHEALKVLIDVSKLIPTTEINSYPATQKHLEKITETRFFLKGYFDHGIVLYSKTGRVIGQIPYSPERSGKDFSDREYFQYTMRTRGPYISKPFKSIKAPYDPIVMFSVPVFGKDGEIAAVLGGAVSLLKDVTFGGIAGIRIGRTGYLYLFNTDRTIIVHPDKTRILKQDLPRGANRLFDAAIENWFEGSGETRSSKDVPGIATFKRFRNTDWILAAHYPIRDAYAPIYRERWYIVAYTAIGIALCVLIILIVMRRNLSPLSELASQAEGIGRTEDPLGAVHVDAGGEIGALASSFNAMLERLADREASLKETMEELRKLHNAVEHSSAVVVITDSQGNIEYVNPKFVEVTGYERSEVSGKTPRILKSGELPREVYDRLWATITTGEEWQGVFHNRKKNGELYWAAASISPLKDATGNITHFVGVQEDITAVKLFEQELKSAKEAAETANQAKSDFLASMSHEIRTPMNAIIGMAELLLEGPLDEEQRRYVTTLCNAGDNLLNIINDILDISKIEAGYLELHETVFDVRELVDAVCDTMAIRVREKGITLDCRIGADVPGRLMGDAGRLRQVLLNLVGNAVKFTEEGGITITVERDGASGANTVLAFSISDTGIGIPEDKIPQIFEKFTQADSSTTRKYGGTGLGLTISRRLVELMGGRIWVTSTVGTGSTFCFTTLLAPAADYADTSAPKEDTLAAPGVIPETRSLAILLVDDSEDNRLLIQSFLKNTPFKVDAARDGREAVDMFTASAYDIVLMDIQMPVMDGYEATRQIRQWELSRGRRATPILALTAYALEEEIRKSYEAGCVGHLTKPVSKSALIEAIKAHAKDIPAVEETVAAGRANDETPLATVVKIDRDLADLIPGYLEKRHADVASIREAAGKNDFEMIRVLGHTMKGSGGGYGFDRITEIGRELEEAAKTGDKEKCLQHANELADYLAHLTIAYQ